MSGSIVFIRTVCISLVLVLLVMFSGCTTTPSSPAGTPPVTSSPIVSTLVSSSEQSPGIRLIGNVYGLTSNPLAGIDTIIFTIGTAPHARAVDLTRMEIVFSTPDTAPVTLTRGTTDTTGTFTTTTGNIPVTSLNPDDQVDIIFRVKAVDGGTKVHIEVKPYDGTPLLISRTVPEAISSTTVLD
jgi:archaellin